MNFYKLNKLINEMAPPAVGLQQPMTTNNKNLPDNRSEQDVNKNLPDNRSKQDINKNLAKISRNLGEKGNKYQKLVQFVGRNPEMLALLDDLLGDVGGMHGSKFGNIYK